MKLTVQKTELYAAIAFCKTIVRTGENPILSNCLIRASDNQLTVASHAIYSSKQSTIAAKVFEPGITTLPLEALYQIVSGAPKDTVINIVVKDRATISFGRSRYSLGTLPADQFPPLLTAEKINPLPLDEQSRQALFSRPAQLCIADQSVQLYSGVFLHGRGGKVASIASDGLRMLSPAIDADWDNRASCMVPREHATEIARMSADAVFWDGSVIVAETGNNRFCGRLLTVKYGDYAALVPASGPTLEFNRIELASALDRLASLATHGSIVKLSWGDNPKHGLLQFVSGGDGSEQISCVGKLPAGHCGLPPIRLAQLIGLLNGERCKMIFSEAMRPIRIMTDAEPNTIALQAPCRAP